MILTVKGLLNGLMAYWTEEKEAARYYVHLLIGKRKKENKIVAGKVTSVVIEKIDYQELAMVEVERDLKYYSFTNLGKVDQDYPYERMHPGLRAYNHIKTDEDYYIYVEAENKSGEIIAKSNTEKGSVFVLEQGNYSLFY